MTTRRDFVHHSLAAGVLLGPRPEESGSSDKELPPAVDYYDKLGVAKIINAAGTYTYLTASLMPPEVQAAVAGAANHSVRLRDLQTAAGNYLARRLQCEAALVSAGAASALSLGTAGCMTLGFPDGSQDLPARVEKFKTDVLIQKGHRLTHEHALEMCGVRLVEVETLAEYENAFTPNTVMAFFFNAAEQGQIGHADWLRVAHAHGVPCFLDAAASAQIAPSLGRPLAAGGSANVTILQPNTRCEDRLTQIDMRFTKIFRFGGRGRLRGDFDVYNILNSRTILGVNGSYGPLWLRPTNVMGGRMWKVGGQLDF